MRWLCPFVTGKEIAITLVEMFIMMFCLCACVLVSQWDQLHQHASSNLGKSFWIQKLVLDVVVVGLGFPFSGSKPVSVWQYPCTLCKIHEGMLCQSWCGRIWAPCTWEWEHKIPDLAPFEHFWNKLEWFGMAFEINWNEMPGLFTLHLWLNGQKS